MRDHTDAELRELGRKCFMMMIDPSDVSLKTVRERALFDKGYGDMKQKFWANNQKKRNDQ